jgi:hypothetical protein
VVAAANSAAAAVAPGGGAGPAGAFQGEDLQGSSGGIANGHGSSFSLLRSQGSCSSLLEYSASPSSIMSGGLHHMEKAAASSHGGCFDHSSACSGLQRGAAVFATV